jgi:hypothetical protein
MKGIWVRVGVFSSHSTDAQVGRNSMGKRTEGEHDTMYQRERGMKELGCGAPLTADCSGCGAPPPCTRTSFPSQELIGDYRLVRHRMLPTARFIGHCFSSRDHNGYNVNRMVVYHPNGVSGLQRDP